MRQNLYEYLYQSLVARFKNGAFPPGQEFPSQRELCLQYNAGITTVRRVMKMLDAQGYIHTAQGRPSVVTYQASRSTCASYLVQRRSEIADAYLGLGHIMPVLYSTGARLCGEQELSFLRRTAAGILDRKDKLEIEDLFRQANAFFTMLLRPLHNSLVMDLELDSENYLNVPYLSFPGVENPFDLKGDRVGRWLNNAVRQMEEKRFDELYDSIVLMYQVTGKKVDTYLCALEGFVPVAAQTREDISWFRTRGRSELYVRLAMNLIRRIVGGEFDEQIYLPSIPRLMEEYGVMKDTASRAVALLNTLGIARTTDKKGTTLAVRESFPDKEGACWSDPVVKGRLALFMEALQIVALTAGECAASFESIPEDLGSSLESRLKSIRESRISPLSFHILMNCFIQLLPCHSLRNIFGQLDELILWGHYLQTADKSFYPDPRDTLIAVRTVADAVRNRNMAALPDAFGKAFTQIYQDAAAVVSKLPDAGRTESCGNYGSAVTART